MRLRFQLQTYRLAHSIGVSDFNNSSWSLTRIRSAVSSVEDLKRKRSLLSLSLSPVCSGLVYGNGGSEPACYRHGPLLNLGWDSNSNILCCMVVRSMLLWIEKLNSKWYPLSKTRRRLLSILTLHDWSLEKINLLFLHLYFIWFYFFLMNWDVTNMDWKCHIHAANKTSIGCWVGNELMTKEQWQQNISLSVTMNNKN
jgi:hypothetical protein